MEKKEEVAYKGFHEIIKMETEMKGKKVFREKLVLKEGVAAFLLDENERIALVKQYRPVAGVYTYELPAGLLDKPHLTAIETLIEELEEECQLSPSDILSYSETPIHKYYMIVGSSDAKIELYAFKVKAQTELNKEVDDVDVDSVLWLTFDELESLVQEEVIQDGKTINAYYYWKVQRLTNELDQLKNNITTRK